MTAIDTTELENIANLSFNDFKAAHLVGNDVAESYYNRLAFEANAVSQSTTVDYANYAKDVVTNDNARGIFENEYAKEIASENSVNLTVGTDAWLRVQYDKMQADLNARLNSIAAAGTGELSYEQTNGVIEASYQTVGLPTGTSPLYVPIWQLGEHDPLSAQAKFEAYISGSGDSLLNLVGDALHLAFGANVSGAQGLAEILEDYADQAHWLSTMLDAFETMLGNSVPIDGDVQEKLDTIQALFDLGGGVLGQLADWADDLPDLPNLPGIGDILDLPSWIPGVTLPFGLGELAGSPIVLDVDASGTIELAALNGAGSVMWDIDQDGFREASGWITGGDGLLCIDLNSDGTINDHGELFGGTNGYIALAAYDTNSSNTITSSDTQFGDLRVWIDGNADGYSQSGELHTLSSLGITSISTSYTNENYTIAGNQIKFESTFVMNGNTYTSVDAFFAYDSVNTEYAEDYTVALRTLFLPTLRGYGELPDLHIAMSLDETLLEMVEEFSNLDFPDMLKAAFDPSGGTIQDILFRWAGVDTVDPTSRGAYIDARVLEFLEAFMGHGFEPGNVGGTVAATFLMEAWTNALNGFASRLIYQAAGMESLFDGSTSYNPVSDTFAGATTIDLEAIEDLMLSATEWAGKFNTARIVVSLIDETIGVANLSSGDYDDLSLLMPPGTTLEAFLHQITTNAVGTTYGDALDNTIFDLGEDNTIIADGGDDTLIGGFGNDYLQGGTGNDTYVFSVGSGTDWVGENTSEGTDTIWLSGYLPSDVRMWTDSSGHLHIANRADAADHITLNAGATGATGTYIETDIGSFFEQIAFDDTTTLDFTDGLPLEGTSSADFLFGSAYADQIQGLENDDYIYGNRGNDTLNGGAGADYMDSGAGNDTYVFASGSGNDYVYETADAGTDIIQLSGYDTTDIRLSTTSNGNLIITNKADDSDVVTITAATTGASGTYYETDIGSYIEYIEFDDTTTWDLTEGLTLEGTSSADYLFGSANDDQIKGLDEGDYLYGNRGNDTLIGGAGLDYLTGGTGNDTYAFAAGDGNDYVYESAEEGTDTIRLTGYATSDVRMWTDSSGHLHIANKADAADETIIVASTTGASGTSSETAIGLYVENVLFDDTTNWSLTGGLTLEGGSSGDYLYGSQYSDTLSGMDDSDTLYGNRGNDTLIGGAGLDYLTGGTGNDTYAFAAGDGNDYVYESAEEGTDTIRLTGYATSDVRMWTDGSGHLHIVNKADPADETIIVASATWESGTSSETTIGLYVENVLFDDTTNWSLTGGLVLEGGSSGDYLYGSQYNDTLSGMDDSDTLYGNRGNDTLIGGAGADYLYGGAGGDILYGGADTDLMTGDTGGDEFVFENATAFGGSDTITDFSTAEVDTLNISDLLDAYDPLNDAISDFVQITDNGTHSYLSVDADGGGDSFTQIAQLSAVTNIAVGATATETELQAMITAGTLLVA